MRGHAQPAKNIHAIRFAPTNQFVAFHAKAGWNGSGPAKAAFKLHMGWSIDECPDYELVDLTEAYFRLEGLMK